MWLFSKIFGKSSEKAQVVDTNTEILAMAQVIANLKRENEELNNRANRYWELYNDMRTGKDTSGVGHISSYDIHKYFEKFGLSYEIIEDDDYCHIYSREKTTTMSFNREFNKAKANHNWVDEGEALITLKLDNAGYPPMKGPTTLIKSPCSGIIEYDTNKLISCDEEICRIRKYSTEEKQVVIEELERQAIKEAVLAKERKKSIERETLDELIAEGKVFNTAKLSSGKRMSIPFDVASAVWNRDGGQCCICGSKTELEFDHIIPISKGGATSFRNLQLLCKNCNIKKSDKI